MVGKNRSVEKTKKWKNNAFIKLRDLQYLKKSRFVKEQEASGLLGSLGIKAPVSQIPIFGPISF